MIPVKGLSQLVHILYNEQIIIRQLSDKFQFTSHMNMVRIGHVKNCNQNVT